MFETRKFGKRLLLLGLLLLPLLCPAAESPGTNEEVPPPWAYAVDPPGLAPQKDDGTLRHVPDSNVALTLTQVRDGFVAPDWHPGDHPPMPEIVSRGRKPDVMACG